MANKFMTFKEVKEQKSGRSDAEAIKVSIQQFEKAAKKRASFTSAELRRVIQSLPINYMSLVAAEKEQLLKMINAEIDLAKQQLAASSQGDISTAEAGGKKRGAQNTLSALESRKDKLINEYTDNWGYLQNLRKDWNKIGDEEHLGHKDVSVSALRMEILEKNWGFSKKDGELDAHGKRQLEYVKKAKALLAKIDKLDAVELRELGYTFQPGATLKEIPDLIELAEQDMSINVKLVKETYASLTQGYGRMSVEIEPSSINKYKGSLSKLVSGMVDTVLKNKFKTQELLDNFNVEHIGFSPSFAQDIETLLTTAILGRKSTAIKRKNVSKTEQKAARSQKLQAAKNKVKNKKLPKLPTVKAIKAGVDLPLFNIMALINEALAEQIKDNMGDSNDPPVLLRNQSGRFSESAKLLTLTRAQAGVLLGTYTYQRNPYDVFLPGGKLHTPKRNPRVYVEGSIRELAIAIMKRKFPGLALELV